MTEDLQEIPAATVLSHVAPDGKTTAEMLSFVRLLVCALVDRPQEVVVAVGSSAATTTLCVTVAPADLGKVIGKQGRTAGSLRALLSAASMKRQHRFELDIQKQTD